MKYLCLRDCVCKMLYIDPCIFVFRVEDVFLTGLYNFTSMWSNVVELFMFSLNGEIT